MRPQKRPSKPAVLSRGVVPRLTSTKEDGKPYERWPDVEKEIERTLGCPRSDWTKMADSRGQDQLSNETLVFLIRECSSSDPDIFGQLVNSLSRRIKPIAERWAGGLDPCTTEEIIKKVTEDIIDLLLVSKPCRQSEFLQIAFGKAVERRTINLVSKVKQDALSSAARTVDLPTDNKISKFQDKSLRQDELIVQLEMIRNAQQAVKDLRHLKAVILRFCYGWPITDKNPEKPSLERLFGVGGRQIQNWINSALDAMRDAIGDKR